MRNFIDIVTRIDEARRGLAPIGEMRAKVFWNPRHSDLLNMLARSKIGDLRGSYLETESETLVAIWPARNLGHWNFHNECFNREGILARNKIDLRITRDLSVLEEERYWHNIPHYEGEGFFCAFHGSTDPLDIPQLRDLFGPLKPVPKT